MKPEPIYAETSRPMKVACFVSGSGTNARRIIEGSMNPDSRYKVTLIFTDVRDSRRKKDGSKRCKALEIAEEYNIDYECVDIRDFYRERGVKRAGDLTLRPEFDRLVVKAVKPYSVDIIALAGYMSITTKPLLDAYPGRIINVHPADLSIMEGKERKYTGIHVVKDAILSGDKELRSTTHIVREKVDHGEILIISKPVSTKIPDGETIESLKIDRKLLNKTVNAHQDQLKTKGDWIIYPLTVQMIAEGRFSLLGSSVYFDGVETPSGFKL
jgi:folate-dependent phosphoribosylglycinamide formyltransferase PurN